jgi:hypothetical protein
VRSLPTLDNIEKLMYAYPCPEWGQNPQSYSNQALDRTPTVISTNSYINLFSSFNKKISDGRMDTKSSISFFFLFFFLHFCYVLIIEAKTREYSKI